jgi:transcriptional regulator with XRE-family HTH domain
MTAYRSKRMKAIHSQPRRAIAANEWTPDQDPGRLFQPWALTTALDLEDLWDPELSAAVGCVIGEIDRWEEGTTAPTVEQAKALARITGFPLRWFYQPGPPPEMTATIFMCPGGAVEPQQIEPLGRSRWKIKRHRPDALLPDALFPEIPG